MNRTRVADVKPNWLALMFWGLILLASVLTWLYGVVLATQEDRQTARFQQTLQSLEVHVRDIAYQSRRVHDGSDEAIDRLSDRRMEVGQVLSLLDFQTPAGFGRGLQTELQTLSDVWARLEPRMDQLNQIGADRGVVRDVDTRIREIHEQTAELWGPLEVLGKRLIEVEAPLPMIDLGYRLSLQAHRILDSTHTLVTGTGDSIRIIDTLRDDLEQLSEILFQMQDMVEVDIVQQVDAVATAFELMLAPFVGVMTLAGDYTAIRNAALTIDHLSGSLLENVRALNRIVSSEARKPMWMVGWLDEQGTTWMQKLPWMIGLSGLLGLVGFIWTLAQFVSRRKRAVAIRHRQSREAMNRLLGWLNSLGQKDLTMAATVTDGIPGEFVDSMNRAIGEFRQLVRSIRIACGELSEGIARSEPLINGLQSGHKAQTDSIRNVVDGMGRIRETLEGMRRSVSESSAHARQTARTAEDSGHIMEGIVTDMSRIHGRIERTQDGLKRLGHSVRQVSETVTLIEEVTEQTNVLALNASIQASMAGEAESGFSVMANEAKRLAERFAEAAGGISGVARIIQNDTAVVIQELESTIGEVVEGSQRMAQARQSQHELRRIVREWQGMIDPLTNLASKGIDHVHRSSTDLADLDQTVEKAERTVRQAALILGEVQGALEMLERSASGFHLPD